MQSLGMSIGKPAHGNGGPAGSHARHVTDFARAVSSGAPAELAHTLASPARRHTHLPAAAGPIAHTQPRPTTPEHLELSPIARGRSAPGPSTPPQAPGARQQRPSAPQRLGVDALGGGVARLRAPAGPPRGVPGPPGPAMPRAGPRRRAGAWEARAAPPPPAAAAKTIPPGGLPRSSPHHDATLTRHARPSLSPPRPAAPRLSPLAQPCRAR